MECLRGKGGLKEAEGIAFAKKLEEVGVDMIQVAQANHTGNMGDYDSTNGRCAI